MNSTEISKVENGFYFFSFLDGLIIHLMGVYLIIWLVRNGLSYAFIGFISSIYLLIITILDIPLSSYSDKHGRLKLYVVGRVIYGIGLILLGFIVSIEGVLISYIIMALGISCSRGSLEAWIYDFVKDENIAVKLFSRQQSLNGFAGIIGGFLAGSIYTILGMMNIPIIIAGILSTSPIITIFFLPDNIGVGDQHIKQLDIIKSGIRYVINNKPLLLLAFSSFIMSFCVVAWMQYWTPYIVEILNFPEAWLGILYSVLLGISSLSGILNEKLSNYIDYRIVTILSTILLPLSLIIMGALPYINITLYALGVISISYILRSANLLTWENKLIISEERSTILSTLYIFTGISLIVAPTIVGIIIDLLTFPIMYIIIGIFGILSTIFVLAALGLESLEYRSEI
jgi:MFS family permease